MIAGIGTDIIEIERVRRVLESSTGERFVRRVLTDAEREVLAMRTGQRQAAEYVACRFAAKEAVAKALGCGIGAFVGFADIEITPDRQGKPICLLSERSRAKLGVEAKDKLHVSISHSETHGIAFAVWERSFD